MSVITDEEMQRPLLPQQTNTTPMSNEMMMLSTASNGAAQPSPERSHNDNDEALFTFVKCISDKAFSVEKQSFAERTWNQARSLVSERTNVATRVSFVDGKAKSSTDLMGLVMPLQLLLDFCGLCLTHGQTTTAVKDSVEEVMMKAAELVSLCRSFRRQFGGVAAKNIECGVKKLASDCFDHMLVQCTQYEVDTDSAGKLHQRARDLTGSITCHCIVKCNESGTGNDVDADNVFRELWHDHIRIVSERIIERDSKNWKSDRQAPKQCPGCGKSFGDAAKGKKEGLLAKIRWGPYHHCRINGNIYCGNCVKLRLLIDPSTGKARVEKTFKDNSDKPTLDDLEKVLSKPVPTASGPDYSELLHLPPNKTIVERKGRRWQKNREADRWCPGCKNRFSYSAETMWQKMVAKIPFHGGPYRHCRVDGKIYCCRCVKLASIEDPNVKGRTEKVEPVCTACRAKHRRREISPPAATGGALPVGDGEVVSILRKAKTSGAGQRPRLQAASDDEEYDPKSRTPNSRFLPAVCL